jgi:acetyl-CoA C-acetyltransferase
LHSSLGSRTQTIGIMRAFARGLATGAARAEVCIVAAARTPIGGFNGSLAPLSAPQLGAAAISGALAKAGLDGSAVQQCWMGNVLSVGVGQAPARQAARAAGLPDSTECTTINKVCSSGMKAIVLGAQQIELGLVDVVVAGGFESMSNVPYTLPKARWGGRMGDAKMVDVMVSDGLWDPYGDCHMGKYAELCASTYNITREDQDAHADESYRRARAAAEANALADEIVPVTVKQGRKEAVVTLDDEPQSAPRPASAGRPAFQKENGTVTAANASTISDGAAAVVLMSRAAAEKHGCTVLATLKGYGDAEQDPAFFTTAPALALPKALAHAGVSQEAVDLFEINEAFSVVSVANNRILNLDPAKVNVDGGAVSLGHPIGASGARIVVSLLHVLKRRGGKIGAAAICNGGGGASALVVEMA